MVAMLDPLRPLDPYRALLNPREAAVGHCARCSEPELIDPGLSPCGTIVAMRIGCSLLPQYASRIHQDGVVYKPIEPPNFVRTLAILKRKGSGDLVNRFYQFAVENFADDAALS